MDFSYKGNSSKSISLLHSCNHSTTFNFFKLSRRECSFTPSVIFKYTHTILYNMFSICENSKLLKNKIKTLF